MFTLYSIRLTQSLHTGRGVDALEPDLDLDLYHVPGAVQGRGLLHRLPATGPRPRYTYIYNGLDCFAIVSELRTDLTIFRLYYLVIV